MNYRLGPFGFLNTEDLPAEDLQVGLKDQITCLKWLRLNIAAFGGDPDKITIWGQSAGALAVSTLVTYLYDTPSSTLFRAAIMDSGSPTSHTVPPVHVYDRPGMPYSLLVNGTGCDTTTSRKHAPKSRKARSKQADRLGMPQRIRLPRAFECKRGLAPNSPLFSPSLHLGPSYKEQTKMKEHAAVGPSLGFNGSPGHSDAYLYSYMSNSSVLDLSQVDSKVYKKSFGTLPRRTIARLPLWYRKQHIWPTPDLQKACCVAPRRLWARTASPHQPVYVYYYDGPQPSNVHAYDGVSHSSELPLVFGNIDEEDLPVVEIKETRALAEKVRNRYISFAYELNPGNDWPAYTPRASKVMRFNKKVIQGELIEDDWRAEQIDYLNSETALNTYQT
ncbi:hypothetical protein Pst134EB_001416 [Puccinia striiformis f. sp. tritici]|nr:hypothetical protein Pst134EB_001416 [Puccinia striiformis f. sp. tritici]